jgi:hypothetical protein
MQRKNDKLCIIGSTESKRDAPYLDQSYDIWAISGAAHSESLGDYKATATVDNHWNDVHRVDAFFEMHKHYEDKIDKLNWAEVPVVMLKADPVITLSETYPVDEIAQSVGDEFTSSIAYMIAYGIYLGYSEIHLFGVNMAHQSEYAHQRGGVKYFAAIAKERGIRFTAPDESQLAGCKQRYGYDDFDTVVGWIQQRMVALKADIEKQEKVVEAATKTLWQLKGAVIDCDDLILTIKGGIA